jgi:hypothetical protein
MTRISCALFALLVGLAIWTSSQRQATAQNSKEPEVSDFGSGVVLLSIRPTGKEDEPRPIPLTDAKLVRIGDRYFVRGKFHIDKPLQGDDYRKGMVVGVDWKDVSRYVVLDEQQYAKSAEQLGGQK